VGGGFSFQERTKGSAGEPTTLRSRGRGDHPKKSQTEKTLLKSPSTDSRGGEKGNLVEARTTRAPKRKSGRAVKKKPKKRK